MASGGSWHPLSHPKGVSAEATLVRASASRPVVSARDIDAEVEQEETEWSLREAATDRDAHPSDQHVFPQPEEDVS